MFGLNDNNTSGNYADTTQMSASDTSAVNPGALDAPASTPAGPPATNDVHNSGAPMPPASPRPPIPAADDKPAGMSDVSLDNAYIDNGPAKTDSAQKPLKPTAASLVSGEQDDELLKLKQQALQSLAPLVDHLDQDPEEKFKTTMMMIQASDNADLIPEAYEAANKIPDEKVRAQALLDVVNEINYFTQHPAEPQQ